MPKRPQKKSNLPDQPIQPENIDAMPEPGDIGLHAIATLDKHKKTVIIGTLVAAIAICAGLVFRQIGVQKQSAAASAYSQAASERSIEKLDAVLSDHAGTNAAGNALLTKSEIQLSLDKPEDAKIALLSFVDRFKKHPRYVQGLFALGNLFQNSGDPAQAANYYKQALAAGPDSDIGPMIVIRQGDLALEEADRLLKEGKGEEAQAKKDEARAFYEDSVRRLNFRSNPFISKAEEKIDLLAIGDVPVVAAPPPPPAPEPVKLKPGTGTVLAPPGAGKAVPPKAPVPGTDKSEPKKPANPDAPKPGPDSPKKEDVNQPPAPAPAKPAAPKPAENASPDKPAAPKPAAPKPAEPKADAAKPAEPKPAEPKAEVEKKADSPPAPEPAPAPVPPAPKPE